MSDKRKRRVDHGGEVSGSHPTGHAADRDAQRELEAILSALRSLDRQVFLAACIDLMPDDEIARHTGLKVAAVEHRLARAVVAFDRARRGIRPPWWQRLRRLQWWPF